MYNIYINSTFTSIIVLYEDKKILLGIIDELEKFENTLSNDDTPEIDDFILYLCSKNVDLRTSAEVQIAQQISLLHRYSKF